MTSSLRSSLDPRYRHLLPDLFDGPVVEERRATCDSCPMGDKGCSAAASGEYTFRADTKCCTYHPNLPNFLVGALLRDTSADHEEGRRRVRAKIERRIGVTPQWLAAPRKTSALFEASKQRGFGRSKALLCPYHDAGSCTIWRYREAVCSTYFCRHEQGEWGFEFWHALKDYLSLVEIVVSRWAARTVDPATREPRVPHLQMTVEDLEDRPPPAAEYASYWGAWLGREEAFYVACTERVEQLDAARFAELLAATPKGELLLSKLRERYAALVAPAPAKHLVLNRRLGARPVPGGAVMTSYSPCDPLFLSAGLARALGTLSEGESMADSLARLEREHGARIPDELLLELRAFGVLVPPAAPAPPAAGDAAEKIGAGAAPAGAPLEPRLGRAIAALQSQAVDEAAGLLAEILAAEPEHAVALHLLGLCQVQCGRVPEAIDLLQRALDVYPGYLDACNNLGNLLLQTDDPAGAERCFRRALELSPLFAATHNNLGVCLMRQERADEARAAFQMAVALDPSEGHFRDNLRAAHG